MNYIFIEGQEPIINDLTAGELIHGDFPMGAYLHYGGSGPGEYWYSREPLNDGFHWLSVDEDDVPAAVKAKLLLLL